MIGRYLLFIITVLLNLFVYAQPDINELVDRGYSELQDGQLLAAKGDLEKAITLLPKQHSPLETAILHNNLGVVYYQLGEFKKGIDQYTLSLQYYQHLKNDTLIAESLLNLGLVYKEIGATDRAMEELVRAARIFERKGILKELASAWNAMGNIQRELRNFDNALEYHQKALTIRKQLAYEKGIADSYHNIGSVYLDAHQLEKAEWYLLEALGRKRKLGNEWNTLTTLTLLGQLYLAKNQSQKAFLFLNAAYNMRIEAGSSAKIASSLYYLGTYYSKTGDRTKALESFRQAEKLAKESGDFQLLANSLSEEISLLGTDNNQLLIRKYQELTGVREQVVDEENRKEIARLEIKYDVERKEREIRLNRKQAKIKAVELENQRLRNRQLIGWLAGTVFAMLLVMFAWYFLRKRKKRIEQQNVELEVQKQEIMNLHHELSHRTKNYFGMLSGILKSDKSNVQHPETARVLEENIRRLDAMSLVQHYLLADSSQRNKEVRLDSYLDNLIDLLLLNLLPHNHPLKLTKDLEALYLDYDVAMRLAIVLNELVCNVIEHGLENNTAPELAVSVKRKQKSIHLIVKDNGMGISDQSIQTIHAKGLSLIEKLLQKIGGSISFKNDQGCVVEVIVKH
jgi:two-component system, sensor histidine kinase PdtaS